MEWTVVTVLAALMGLFVTIGKPIVELNRSITRLNTMLEVLGQRLDRLETDSHQTHTRLWDALNRQGQQLTAHERRIAAMEKGGNER